MLIIGQKCTILCIDEHEHCKNAEKLHFTCHRPRPVQTKFGHIEQILNVQHITPPILLAHFIATFLNPKR